MNWILNAVGHIERLAQAIRSYAEEYEERKKLGYPVKLKRKMILRRIESLQSWLRALEDNLKEEEKNV